MTLDANNGNGRGAAVGTATIAVPPPFQAKLQELAKGYEKARADLMLFQDMLFLAMGLPPGSNWNLDTDTMTLTRLPDNVDA